MKPAARVTTIFMSAVAVLHLARLLFQVDVTAGDATIPMWASVFGMVVPGALAAWLWREQQG
jgi:hypothetical protein